MTSKIKIGSRNGVEVLVDTRFYATLNRYTWSLNKDGYVRTNFKCEHIKNRFGYSTVQLHQMVMTLSHELPDVCLCDASYLLFRPKVEINHKNANKLDCRLENLEYETKAMNSSLKGDRSGHSSRYNGVQKFFGRWIARYTQGGTRKHIGSYDTEIEAARAHDAKCRELGLDRMLNFPPRSQPKILSRMPR